MRKQTRSAAVVVTVLLGASSLAATLLHPALAQENQDRTDSAEYTDSRADYWAAREAWAAKKAAQEAGEEVPDEGTAPVAETVAAPPSGGGESSSGAGGGDAVAPAPVPDGYPTNAQLYQLRMCESTDNYWANTGNGYYGAYQFSPITWWWLGYTGYPHDAPAWQQDEAVRYLYSLMGWSPWPACSQYLGFA